MTVHLVRLGGSILRHEFRIEGMVQPSLEALVTRTIDRFYAVTGPLAASLGVEKVYTVHLEQKGGNNYAPGNRLNLNTEPDRVDVPMNWRTPSTRAWLAAFTADARTHRQWFFIQSSPLRPA